MNWTPTQNAFLKRYLKSQIDRVWNYWPPRLEARRRAQGKTPGRQICAICGPALEYPKKDTHVDHIDPTVPVKEGFTDWGTYISRKFVQVDKLQILCLNHHSEKTKKEAGERAKSRRAKKETK